MRSLNYLFARDIRENIIQPRFNAGFWLQPASYIDRKTTFYTEWVYFTSNDILSTSLISEVMFVNLVYPINQHSSLHRTIPVSYWSGIVCTS